MLICNIVYIIMKLNNILFSSTACLRNDYAASLRSRLLIRETLGPKFPPTKGEPWPKPQLQVKNNTVLTFDPAHFEVKVVDVNCPLLKRVIARYSDVFAHLMGRVPTRRGARSSGLAQLRVHLTAPCEDYPHYGMDESYNLTVAVVSTLKSASIWGIMRGFQTFTHLFYLSNDYKEIRINATDIQDYPRFPHRGLLLDTGRHYLSLHNIFLTLDAMEMNKFNVLHWHMVDDQSFPYQSDTFPELSEHGAYFPTFVYSKANIQLIVEYARGRGIRIVPEFDVPGHTLSWGQSHAEILTKCYNNHEFVGLGPMNPIKNSTYELLGGLITELRELFPDKYFHVGGDEIEFICWESNPELQDYMKQHNIITKDLFSMFMKKTFSLLGKTQPIVWQEVFDNNVPLSPDTPVQIWKKERPKEDMNKVLEAGHKVLFSSLWYLDHLKNGGDWEKYYTDPKELVDNASLAGNIIGGEACMWGEAVDDTNVISRVWPRASAVAEMLWSSKFDLNKARNRLEEHACRMNRRNIAAQPPNGPGFCVGSTSTQPV